MLPGCFQLLRLQCLVITRVFIELQPTAFSDMLSLNAVGSKENSN